jgi:hypothetical protein
MNSFLMFLLGVVLGPFIWLFGFVVFDLVIASYEYAKFKKEVISERMKEVLREFGIMK